MWIYGRKKERKRVGGERSNQKFAQKKKKKKNQVEKEEKEGKGSLPTTLDVADSVTWLLLPG